MHIIRRQDAMMMMMMKQPGHGCMGMVTAMRSCMVGGEDVGSCAESGSSRRQVQTMHDKQFRTQCSVDSCKATGRQKRVSDAHRCGGGAQGLKIIR